MLTTEDKILIEQRISNEKPSAGVAYLLAIFLGTGVVMLLISLTFFGLAITYIWVLIDLFLIPGMIREKVDLLRRDLTLSAAAAAA
jgi:TM2 domain-containing membrane protein YozV